ncbi:hypothetical protein COLO4_05942 [Corchorus olitorius]|uniref:Uncharacterized protein n=1 Tax=Corchorus olitorius TaxID=93759 RepID=A0A1R3KPL5_9ROSI|nr:hypothetical protein COLO4_05942 [Corchorus olitorius]
MHTLMFRCCFWISLDTGLAKAELMSNEFKRIRQGELVSLLFTVSCSDVCAMCPSGC